MNSDELFAKNIHVKIWWKLKKYTFYSTMNYFRLSIFGLGVGITNEVLKICGAYE